MRETSSRDPGETTGRTIGVFDLFGMFLKLIFWLLVLLTPVLGFWVSSSLAAYANFSLRLCAAAGLLAFPALPLLWELYAGARRRPGPRWLTFPDRMILRTLAINLPLLGGLLACYPERSFVALSARGDWMLEGRSGPQIEAARRLLFAAATHLEGLYKLAHRNPYHDQEKKHPEEERQPGPQPKPQPKPLPKPLPIPTPRPTPQPDQARPAALSWPMAAELHPAVKRIPAAAEESVESVGRYFLQEEPDPLRRIKALHDYVADRVAYDTEALFKTGVRWDDNQPEVVLRRRKGVCMGYAMLLRALGEATGDRIYYVTGDVRDGNGEAVGGVGHAWNVAQVGERFYLIDATWDSGSVDTTYHKGYTADYLMTPPEVFGLDHFPEEARWQLRAEPLDRGAFVRQPALRPAFYAQGWRLHAPDRSQVTVAEALDIEIQNPAGRFATATATPLHGGAVQHCEGSWANPNPLRLRCPLPASGSYRVTLFSGEKAVGQYQGVGMLYANRR